MDHLGDNSNNDNASGPQGSGDSDIVDASRQKVDAETARELAPYFQPSRQLAIPTRSQRAKRQVLERASGLGARFDEWKLGISNWFEVSTLRLILPTTLAAVAGSEGWQRCWVWGRLPWHSGPI